MNFNREKPEEEKVKLKVASELTEGDTVILATKGPARVEKKTSTTKEHEQYAIDLRLESGEPYQLLLGANETVRVEAE